MLINTRNWIMAGMLGMLVACGGGGGGNSAPGVEPGPPPPGQAIPPEPIPPTPSQTPYAEAEVLNAFITDATINGDDQAVINFQLTDGNGVAITDLVVDDVRFVISKLETSPLGNLTGSWQSYINVVAQPEVGTGTVPELQATYERDGVFTNNGDGTYTYQYAISLTNLPQDILDQAGEEGLDLTYDPSLTHRVAIQFDGAPGKANPSHDWVPATGATDGIFTMDIAATANCNRCHDPLAIHGGGRIEVKYCVTCHNPGSVDPDSTNTVDFKVMVHKIHMGANLPSVQEGQPYVIYGFRNSPHDYSNIHYPQDIRNCVNCHAGSATGTGLTFPDGSDYELTLTDQGDNWSIYPTQAACGSCHDALDFSKHAGGQSDDSNCASCHSTGGIAGSIQQSHAILEDQARATLNAEVESVRNSMPGETPVISFRVSNPETGDDYDIMSDPIFTGPGARLAVGMAWNNSDYTNNGNGMDTASQVQADALADAVSNGDGSYSITMPSAIPKGGVASGSGTATVEGHPVIDLEGNGELEAVPVGDATGFFSIDEPDGQPVPRRVSVEMDNCLSCHQSLVLHGGNRSDNIDSCTTCHNPRNTDHEVREIASDPPTDGKDEQSIHFKVMIHGIHAAGILENPLQIVGFRGFSTHVYDEETVHYPGNLANCLGCHDDNGYTLPLPAGTLGTTVDTGANKQSPLDDTVVTPATAACASCHDDDVSAAHMTSNGGSFNTTQAAIDSGEVVEQCSVCHGSGKTADVSAVHDID
jgi:OmcA/MtrC family decaheme c-type cytochrome